MNPVIDFPTMPPVDANDASLPKTQATFYRLLHQWRTVDPEARSTVEQTLWTIFGQTQAIMILDMSGFSKTANTQGILPALSRIQHMNTIAVPQLEAQGGQVIKSEADNIFAIFPTVDAAVAASFNTFKSVQAEGLNVAIGIGYGSIFVIEDPVQKDFFGDEVNLASKLGEDTAEGGELMITEAAYQQLQTPDHRWAEFHLGISGIQMVAYQYQFEESDLSA
ncbi:adenylate/guanylate cyclase domain-containing protein [Alkalinema pantanalense CENA528]|uniref:adenylate/guanylate cyclase domain-containing protein n=1 Tax=Alkalinema pantanalense TaxID=1620705 RepID=UPI003D6DC5B5